MAAFSPHGKSLAVSVNENDVHLWRCAKDEKEATRSFVGHKYPVTEVAFSPDGKRLASASKKDYSVRIWDVDTGKVLWELTGHNDVVTCVAWLPDGRHVVSGSSDKTVKLWELPD